MTIEQALDRLLELGGADLLISCGSSPRIRRDGKLELQDGTADVLTPADTEQMAKDVLDADQLKGLGERRHGDLGLAWRAKARVRGNVFYQRNSLAMAFRLLPLVIPTFEMLGIPEAVHRLLGRHHGLILVTGSTGSGKSTTQAAMINHLNNTRPYHIITIEDPIEYVHKHKLAIVDQRPGGRDP